MHRKALYEIKQSPGETINIFVAKLKGKAEHCNFAMRCAAGGCDEINNYVEEMIGDQLTTGLYDQNIKQEVLAKDKQFKTFEDRYALIEAYELGKQAKSQLESNHTEANAVRSQYQVEKSAHITKSSTKRCPGCNSNTFVFENFPAPVRGAAQSEARWKK